MSRNCGQRFTTDNRRTLTKVLGADKMRYIVPVTANSGEQHYNAMFDCKSGFPQIEDKRNLHLHKFINCHIHLLYLCLRQTYLEYINFLFLLSPVYYICME